MIDNPMEMYNPYFATGNDSQIQYPNGNANMLEYTSIPALPKDAAVTMAYIPFQTKSMLYTDEKALSVGTLFEALDKPFLGGSMKR